MPPPPGTPTTPLTPGHAFPPPPHRYPPPPSYPGTGPPGFHPIHHIHHPSHPHPHSHPHPPTQHLVIHPDGLVRVCFVLALQYPCSVILMAFSLVPIQIVNYKYLFSYHWGYFIDCCKKSRRLYHTLAFWSVFFSAAIRSPLLLLQWLFLELVMAVFPHTLPLPPLMHLQLLFQNPLVPGRTLETHNQKSTH